MFAASLKNGPEKSGKAPTNGQKSRDSTETTQWRCCQGGVVVCESMAHVA